MIEERVICSKPHLRLAAAGIRIQCRGGRLVIVLASLGRVPRGDRPSALPGLIGVIRQA